MGQTPKSKLEALKRERRQAKAARKRAEKVRSMQVRFLIVCEGTQTEPLYFKALSKVRRSAVAEVREGDIVGLGRSTCVLVRDTKKLRDQLERERGLRFDRVWVVFDKDDNPDFNDAITLAEKCGINCAWSNEAFELWYVLHFVRLDTAIDRSAYIRILEREVRRHAGYGNYQYAKNACDTYAMLCDIGNEEQAKTFARQLRNAHVDRNYQAHVPCTCVDLLVDELENTERVLARLDG